MRMQQALEDVRKAKLQLLGVMTQQVEQDCKDLRILLAFMPADALRQLNEHHQLSAWAKKLVHAEVLQRN